MLALGSLERAAWRGQHPSPTEDPEVDAEHGGGSLSSPAASTWLGHRQFGVYSSLVTKGVARALGRCWGRQGLELGLGSPSPTLCCRQLLQGIYFWPLGQGRACSRRQAPGLAGAEGYFWLWLLTRQASLSQLLPL